MQGLKSNIFLTLQMFVINSTCLSSYFFSILYPNSSWTTIFLITYVSSVSWRNIWERLMIYCLVWKKLTRKVGYNFVLVWKLCFSLWCLKPMLQITVFQLLLQQLITMTNSLGCEEAFMTLPKQFLRGSAWFFFFFFFCLIASFPCLPLLSCKQYTTPGRTFQMFMQAWPAVLYSYNLKFSSFGWKIFAIHNRDGLYFSYYYDSTGCVYSSVSFFFAWLGWGMATWENGNLRNSHTVCFSHCRGVDPHDCI